MSQVRHHYDDVFNIAQLEQELSEQVVEQETLSSRWSSLSTAPRSVQGSFAPATAAYFPSGQVK